MCLAVSRKESNRDFEIDEGNSVCTQDHYLFDISLLRGQIKSSKHMEKDTSKGSKIDQTSQLRIHHSEIQGSKIFDLVETIRELEEIHDRINEKFEEIDSHLYYLSYIRSVTRANNCLYDIIQDIRSDLVNAQVQLREVSRKPVDNDQENTGLLQVQSSHCQRNTEVQKFITHQPKKSGMFKGSFIVVYIALITLSMTLVLRIYAHDIHTILRK